MNKKGDISIAILVLLVLVLCISVLFIFLKNTNKPDSIIADARVVENVFNMKEQIGFYVQDIARKTVTEEYFRFLEEKGIGSDDELTNYIRMNFVKDYKYAFNLYDFDEPKLAELLKMLSDDKFVFIFNTNRVSIEIPEFSLTSSLAVVDKKRVWVWGVFPTTYTYGTLEAGIASFYNPKITTHVLLEEIGLPKFSALTDAKNACINEVNSESCFASRVSGFDIIKKVDSDGKVKFELTSRRLYLADGKLMPLVILV